MLKKLAIMIACGAALALAACENVNKASNTLGGPELANIYENATSYSDKAYVTIRLYETTIDAALKACDPANPDSEKTPTSVCDAADAAVQKISPAVQISARLIGDYVYAAGKVKEFQDAGQPVPANVTAAASEAYLKASQSWSAVSKDLEAYLGKK